MRVCRGVDYLLLSTMDKWQGVFLALLDLPQLLTLFHITPC